MIGALLGHTQAQTTNRYAHLMDDPLQGGQRGHWRDNRSGAQPEAAVSGRRRRAQPTSAAVRQRKAGVHRAYRAPMLPTAAAVGEEGKDVRRALAREFVTLPLAMARADFLEIAARLQPQVLTTLALAGRQGDPPALDAWADRWQINVPWVLVIARNTVRLWHHWPVAEGRRWGSE